MGSRSNPVTVDSSYEPREIHIDINKISGISYVVLATDISNQCMFPSPVTYWPASETRVFPGIAATRRVGVWRLLRFEYRTPYDAMEEDLCGLQPESEGFILVELKSGL